jgi:hypothetical protein
MMAKTPGRKQQDAYPAPNKEKLSEPPVFMTPHSQWRRKEELSEPFIKNHLDCDGETHRMSQDPVTSGPKNGALQLTQPLPLGWKPMESQAHIPPKSD